MPLVLTKSPIDAANLPSNICVMSFPFEKLQAYNRAVEWYRQINSLLDNHSKQIPYGFADQLRRAALSVSLNLAEGNGRWHLGDKKQFFWIARGSAFECVPLLSILKIDKVIKEDLYTRLRKELEELSKMITGLIQYQERNLRSPH